VVTETGPQSSGEIAGTDSVDGDNIDPADALRSALDQWTARLGTDHVLTGPDALDRVMRSTLPQGTTPHAVLRPADADEVAEIARIAQRWRVPLYPISRGRNWGYGDACAVTDGQVIVDLGRMNRILEIDDELAYAVLEPGVSQKQLSDALRERGGKLWLDCTGAGDDASVVGNILERGFGHTPYGNRVQTVCGMDVVLADGRILRTGFGHYDRAQTRYLFPYGLGPSLDGLFMQSGMGIVTRLGLWLMPKPESFNLFLCSVERHEDVVAVIDALRPLRLDGTLRSIIHIGNDLRVLSGAMTFPHDLAGGATALPDAVRARLRNEAQIGAWMVAGSLYGRREQVAAARRALTRALRGPGRKLNFLGEDLLAHGERVAGLIGWTRWGRKLAGRIATARSLFDLNRGVPSRRFLAGAYWRYPGGLPDHFPDQADPARDRCGLLWLSPVLPMRGAAALDLHDRIDPIFRRHGFDLFITISMINERALGAVLTVAYDHSDAAETARAKACYDELFRTIMDAGYIPYRVGIQSMGELALGSEVFWDVTAALKEAIDPQAIMSPGRYDPMRVRRDR
jgi:4-cresol dehydrogenase (hydroxylating) flavoprotein subunit